MFTNSSIPYLDSSRPIPLCLIPPNGILGSDTSTLFTETIPRLPPEWEPHEATWLVWPQNSNDWPGKFGSIKWVYSEIIKNLVHYEKLRILVDSEKVKKSAEFTLNKPGIYSDQIEFYIIKTDRSWIRDSGPMFVTKDRVPIILNFRFNAWAKYKNWEYDNKVPSGISSVLGVSKLDLADGGNGLVLEGGSIDVNGSGTLITTAQCLLNNQTQVRNTGFQRKDYEELFRRNFGIKNILWLGKGIEGDDTNGHVDNLCRFVNRSTVALCVEDNADDINYVPLKENLDRISGMRLENGSGIDVVKLPMPSPVYFDNDRLPASYANFYIANSVVLVPTYNDPEDKHALGIISELFPDRRVVGINCIDLIWGLGAIHCLTKEQPLT